MGSASGRFIFLLTMSEFVTRETDRLLMRPPVASDEVALFEIQNNADAMQYTYSAPDLPATIAFLKRYRDRFEIDGYMPWTVALKAEDRIIGWGGLNRDPEEPHWGPEVAYFIHQDYWGRGFATDIVDAALGVAFEHVGLEEVTAFTRPANIGSQRVIAKSGFEFVQYVPKIERNQYVITSSAWRSGDRPRY